MQQLLICLTIMLLAVFQGGCATNAPLKTLYYRGEAKEKPKNMIIFLRGRGGSHEDFAADSFIGAVRSRMLPFDMAAPNAHFGYYFGQTLVPRLREDVIEPARAAGYEKFWLVGASMGGLGALMYNRRFPEDVAGIYLISPFLGYESIIDEIKAAGGVSSWEPGPYDPDDDWQRLFWDWLKQSADTDAVLADIYLGYGVEDSFVPAQELIGELLPPGNVLTTSGGHTPEVMKQLWQMFLDKNVLQ